MTPATPSLHLGINIGASSISTVELQKTGENIQLLTHQTFTHQGNPKWIIEEIFKYNTPENIVVTGRKFRTLLNITSIPEAEAVELSADFLELDTDMIISVDA